MLARCSVGGEMQCEISPRSDWRFFVCIFSSRCSNLQVLARSISWQRRIQSAMAS